MSASDKSCRLGTAKADRQEGTLLPTTALANTQKNGRAVPMRISGVSYAALYDALSGSAVGERQSGDEHHLHLSLIGDLHQGAGAPKEPTRRMCRHVAPDMTALSNFLRVHQRNLF